MEVRHHTSQIFFMLSISLFCVRVRLYHSFIIIYRIRLLEEGLSRQKQTVGGIGGHGMSSQLLRLLSMVIPGHDAFTILKGKRYAGNKQGEMSCGHFNIVGY